MPQTFLCGPQLCFGMKLKSWQVASGASGCSWGPQLQMAKAWTDSQRTLSLRYAKVLGRACSVGSQPSSSNIRDRVCRMFGFRLQSHI